MFGIVYVNNNFACIMSSALCKNLYGDNCGFPFDANKILVGQVSVTKRGQKVSKHGGKRYLREHVECLVACYRKMLVYLPVWSLYCRGHSIAY